MTNAQPSQSKGVIGEVKGWPLADYDNLDDFSAPWNVLEQADLSCVNECCRNTDKFCINFWFPTACSPFQRMQFLRGTENLFMDLAMGDECPEVYRLRDLVHEFYVKQLEMWCQTDIDAIHIEDDWGAQKSLLISLKSGGSFSNRSIKSIAILPMPMGNMSLCILTDIS